MKTTKKLTPLRLVINSYAQQLKQEPRKTAISFLLPGIAVTFGTYIPPLVIAHLLNTFGKTGFSSPSELMPYIALLVGVWTLGQMIWRIAIHYAIRLEINGIERLYNQGIDKLLANDLQFFDDNFAGSLTKKITGYARNFEGVVDTLIFSVFTTLIPLVFVTFILWGYSPWLVVGLIGNIVLAFFAVRPFIKRRQKLVDVREAASNVVSGHIADTISNVAAVRTFSREKYEQQRNNESIRDYVKKTQRSWDYQNRRIDLILGPFYVLANAIGLILALALSQNGVLNLGVIFVAFSYYANITVIVWEFNNIYRNIEGNLTDAAQFMALFNSNPTVADSPRAEPFILTKPSIELKNINFKYNDKRGEHLFKDLHLVIKPGEKIGLVGPSGGGKTTIAKLILRVMDVSDGVILVDDRNIKTIRQEDLREYISYVPQDPLLFHRSLADNIRYGKLSASQEDIEAAAKLAYAHDFIEDLDAGYDTLVGERGVKLSGGQRQRVSIARAILKNAPILVLDEATSALDSQSESLIQEALTNLMKDKTTIVIAHRLSTIQKMDRIVVLEDGVITEQGSHSELLEKNGLYAKLWNHQSGGFLED